MPYQGELTQQYFAFNPDRWTVCLPEVVQTSDNPVRRFICTRRLTLVLSRVIPSPVWLLTANADATHEVIVSGTVSCIMAVPSALENITMD